MLDVVCEVALLCVLSLKNTFLSNCVSIYAAVGSARETRRTDAPAFERSKTALSRCDVHAGHLLRACRPTAAMWKVLGAHVAGFHLNTPTPETTARRLRRLFERAAAATVRLRAVLGGPRAREWHELAPTGGRRTRRRPWVAGFARPRSGSRRPPRWMPCVRRACRDGLCWRGRGAGVGLGRRSM